MGMQGIRPSTCDYCCCTPEVVEHLLMVLGIGLAPEHPAGIRSVAIEPESGGLVDILLAPRQYHLVPEHRRDWPGQQSYERAPPQPCVGSPPPSCAPSTPFESL